MECARPFGLSPPPNHKPAPDLERYRFMGQKPPEGGGFYPILDGKTQNSELRTQNSTRHACLFDCASWLDDLELAGGRLLHDAESDWKLAVMVGDIANEPLARPSGALENISCRRHGHDADHHPAGHQRPVADSRISRAPSERGAATRLADIKREISRLAGSVKRPVSRKSQESRICLNSFGYRGILGFLRFLRLQTLCFA